MRAAQIDKYGDIEDITVRDVAKPEFIGDDMVLVKTMAMGLNPYDFMVLSGGAKPADKTNFPLTLGQDFSGTIEAVGREVKDFTIGDRVYGSSNGLFGQSSGAFAEYLTAGVRSIAKIPDSISFDAMAALPTAGVAALQAINSMDLKAGDKLFIHGGAGGIGTVVLQIARSRSVITAATASTDNLDLISELGATEEIDYKKINFWEVLNGYDAVFNTVRGADSSELVSVVKDGGIIVSMTDPVAEELTTPRNIRSIAQQTNVTTERLTELADLVSRGEVIPQISERFELREVQDAYRVLRDKSVRGKVILTLD